MSSAYFKILIILISGLTCFSSVKAGIFDKLHKQSVEIDKPKDSITYYEEGISFYKSAEYLSAEKAFLKYIDIKEKTEENDLLAYSFHYLGNIESWKSNFLQSIQYHKKASNIFLKLKNSKYVAISNNQISSAFESLGEYDSCLVYYQFNIQHRNQIDATYTVLNSYQRIAATYAKLYNYKL
ncbi:MAG: hypothetical protein ABFS35_23990, partial [Bacteroidota bacterium]